MCGVSHLNAKCCIGGNGETPSARQDLLMWTLLRAEGRRSLQQHLPVDNSLAERQSS